MKKFFTAVILAFGTIASAQQDGQQPSDDQIQQQPPRDTQVQMERAAKVDAVKRQSQSDIEAEQAAKAQGQSQKQTKAQPVGINPPDTLSKPRDNRKNDLSKPKKIISEDSKRRN